MIIKSICDCMSVSNMWVDRVFYTFCDHIANAYATACQNKTKRVFIASVVQMHLLLRKMTYIYLQMKCCNYKSHRWSNTLQRANRGLTRHALNTEQYFECRCWANVCLWLHREITDCKANTHTLFCDWSLGHWTRLLHSQMPLVLLA